MIGTTPYADLFQISILIRDLEVAFACFERDHGVANFHRVNSELESIVPGGVARSQVALGWSGARQIEIIQPLSGAVHIYSDALEGFSGLMRFHHFGIRVRGEVEDWARFREGIGLGARPVVFEGKIGEDCHFAYVDERATLGHYLEYMWLSDRFAGTSGMA